MNQAGRILFLVIIAELVVGGGGRLVALGPISLRMVLFAAAMLLTVKYFVDGRRLPAAFNYFLLVFISSLLLGVFTAVMSGTETTFLIEDVKPLLYVLILPFFVFVVEDYAVIRSIPPLIIYGALGLAIVFCFVLALIHSGALPFLVFYDTVIGTGEFFFRAETTFFYKGFIYLCIALIFVFFTGQRYRVLLISIFILAIVLTFTRGFLFALMLTYLVYSLLEKRYKHFIVTLVFAITIALFNKPIIYTLSAALHDVKGFNERVPKDKLLGNRDESDAERIAQAKEVFGQVTPVSFFIGHGFGNGVPSRPVHMEISYLEIFHKQGLIGLAVWAYLYFLVVSAYLLTSRNEMSKAYFFATSFLFLQSLTNQFINNPIGLSFTLLSLTYLHYHRTNERLAKNAENNALRHQKGDGITITSF